MMGYFMHRVRHLAPAFIEPAEGLPPADPDQVAEFARKFLQAGTPAFRAVFCAMILLLQAFCLLTRGRSFYSLPADEAGALIQSMYSHRLSAIGLVPVVLGIPIYMAHYDRDDLQPALGFDIAAMREEAAKRGVVR